jgi:cyclopropane fatty-acyl-phospholipid synthase-like methyltransferase
MAHITSMAQIYSGQSDLPHLHSQLVDDKMSSAEKDNWSTDTYRQAAGFVPKLATKVVDWLDVQPDDRILDLGCGGACLHPRL